MRLGLVILAGLWSACLAPRAQTCGELLCPDGRACAASLGICVFPDQLTACAGLVDAESCRFGDSAGYCREGVCLVAACGNGIVEPGEACDGAHCSADCRSDLRCGNAILDPGEGCDCGDGTQSLPFGCNGANSPDTLATCSSTCVLRGCGDGLVSALEQCDPAAPSSVNSATCQDFGFYETTALRCNAFCRYETTPCSQHCGDHILNGKEICDGAPPLQTCLEYNYDAGHIGCQDNLCVADVSNCRRIGWVRSNAPSPQMTTLFVAGYDEVYGANNTELYHFDGHWTKLPDPPQRIRAIWAGAPNDVYVAGLGPVGLTGAVSHYDGTAWTTILAPPQLSGVVWGAGHDDVFIGGVTGQVWHYDGATVSQFPSLGGEDIIDIAGRAGNDVYAMSQHALYHYDGTVWKPLAAPTQQLEKIASVLPNELVCISGGILTSSLAYYQVASNAWTYETASLNLIGAWGNRSNNLFTVGGAGTIFHFDGAAWSQRAEQFNDFLVNISGDPSGRSVWALADGWVFRYGGAEWQVDPPSTFAATKAVSALPGGTLIVGGNVGSNIVVSRRIGGTWSSISASGASIMAMWADSATNIYLATVTGLLHTDGTTGITNVLGVIGLTRAVWGSGPNDVYAADVASPLRHWNGSTWSATGGPSITLYAIWGTGPNDVFAVGDTGTIRHWNGTAWSTQANSQTDALRAVWGTGPADVFAAGDNGCILHYDGTTWTSMPSATFASFTSLSGTGPNDVFASSGGGVILHYDGIGWTPIRLPSAVGLNAVAASGAQVYFGTTAGQLATLFRTELPWP